MRLAADLGREKTHSQSLDVSKRERPATEQSCRHGRPRANTVDELDASGPAVAPTPALVPNAGVHAAQTPHSLLVEAVAETRRRARVAATGSVS
jgi:hypothetical protein